MDAFFQWLSNNPSIVTTTGFTLAAIIVIIIFMYVIAFFQGRDVSFWPPKIGSSPINTKISKAEQQLKDDESTMRDEPSLPVIRKSDRSTAEAGTELKTARNEAIRISDVLYGGIATSIYKGVSKNNKTVIVKFYWIGVDSDSQNAFLRQFKTEIKASEILKHPSIVKITDRGIHNKFPFIVMEYLAGGTLSDLLRTKDRIPGRAIINIASQIAEAIDFMHQNGVIHRDIKASNILFEENDIMGKVLLGDFGLARFLSEYNQESSNMYTIMGGSPRYVAPELAEGKEPSPASDIYSFGVVLFRMMTGKAPFEERKGVYATLHEKVNTDAPDIRSFRSDITEEVASKITASLSRIPASRPKSAKALLENIEQDIVKL